MKIEITNEEYRTLLDVLHIAEVVLSGHRRQEDPRNEQHRMLIQKLYALAGDAGLGKLIEFDNDRKHYHPTEEFENNAPAHSFVDEFANHVFWDELISRLTARDAAWHAGGLDRLSALGDDEREALERPINERYVEEFSKHGLSNLAVVEQLGGDGEGTVTTSD
jgi:hypothetical protein